MEDKYKYLSDEELNQLIIDTQRAISYMNYEKYKRVRENYQSTIGKYYKEETDEFLEVFKVIDVDGEQLKTICFTIDINAFDGGKDINFYNSYPMYGGLENSVEISKEEYDELLEFTLKEAKDICDSRIN